jgi:hypothetical protein
MERIKTIPAYDISGSNDIKQLKTIGKIAVNSVEFISHEAKTCELSVTVRFSMQLVTTKSGNQYWVKTTDLQDHFA